MILELSQSVPTVNVVSWLPLFIFSGVFGFEVEFYKLSVLDGEFYIATHIYIIASSTVATHIATRSSRYVGTCRLVLYFPILGDGILLVCG